MDKEYSLIIDTNIFYIQKELNDFSSPYLFNKITELVEKLEINDILDKVQICIPKISLMESLKHQDERYDDEINKFVGKTYPLFTPYKKNNYLTWLIKTFNKLLKQNNYFNSNVEILDFPKASDFKSIIKRAILKNDPFEGNNGKGESDKGFKDVLIWHTLLDYKTQNADKKIVLYSNDNKLTGEYCKKEYRQKFAEDLIIAKKDKDPNFDDVIKNLFKLDKIELSIDDKVKKEISNVFSDHFQPACLYGKSIFTLMGEELIIDDIIDSSCIVDRVTNTDDEYILYIRVVVNATKQSDKDLSMINTLNCSVVLKYFAQTGKYKIQSITKLHKDISENEMNECLDFLEVLM